jgi:hypothetical protein
VGRSGKLKKGSNIAVGCSLCIMLPSSCRLLRKGFWWEFFRPLHPGDPADRTGTGTSPGWC